jgi:hypothetical protein
MKRGDLHLSPAMSAVLPIVDGVFQRSAPSGFVVEFTAGQEWSGHDLFSLHHTGNALDIRTRTLPDHGVGALSRRIKDELQREFDRRFGRGRYLALWNDQGPSKPHIHVQFQGGLRISPPGDFHVRATPIG